MGRDCALGGGPCHRSAVEERQWIMIWHERTWKEERWSGRLREVERLHEVVRGVSRLASGGREYSVSMNLRSDVKSPNVWSTYPCLAYGEMIRKVLGTCTRIGPPAEGTRAVPTSIVIPGEKDRCRVPIWARHDSVYLGDHLLFSQRLCCTVDARFVESAAGITQETSGSLSPFTSLKNWR